MTTILFLLEGGVTTVLIWAVTVFCSVPLALVVTLVRVANIRPVNTILDLYLSLVRGTPLLFQLMFVYFGLPLFLRVTLSPFAAASLAFVNSWTAYLSEIFRGGVEGVDKGQYEAGYVLGLSYMEIMREIIFPQALVASLPAVTNQAIEAIWGTALLSTIGMNDILKSARVLIMRDFTVQPFVIAGCLYLIFNGIVILFFRAAEKKVSRYRIAIQKK